MVSEAIRVGEKMESILPTTIVKDSYIEAIKEFQAEGGWKSKDLSEIEADFDAYVEKVKNRAESDDFYKERVPNIEFWLVEGKKYFGSLRLRPELNTILRRIGGNIGFEIRPSERGRGYATKMLELGLVEAKKRGLKEVLLTCDESNVASRKVIEANGGELVQVVTIEEWPVPICHYKIRL